MDRLNGSGASGSSATSGVEGMRNLFNSVTHQLLNGCGSPECKNQYCLTGRKHTSHAPVRPYTARSARAIALALLEEPNLSSHLCFPDNAVLRTPGHHIEVEGRRDPSSFIQRLSDTSSVRKAAGHTITPDPRLQFEVSTSRQRAAALIASLERGLQPPYLSSGHVNPAFKSHGEVIGPIVPALETLYAPGGNRNQAHWKLLAEVINNGNAFPQFKVHGNGDRSWLSLVDAFDDEPSISLCATICKLTAQRTQLDDIAAKFEAIDSDASEKEADESSFIDRIALRFQEIASSYASQDDGWVPWPYPLWFKRVFLKHWDGSPSVKRGTTECGALELLGCLQQIYDKIHDSQKNDAQVLPVISKRIEAQKMAETWLLHQPGVTTASRHLLSCRFLFSPNQMVMYWRMLNHLIMRQAFTTSAVNDELFDKFVQSSETAMIVADQHADSLQQIRDFYLLLKLDSRKDVIRDTFDQLWQRKRSELLRPLRVRLGEMGGMEVGHDLGGVQIEFFNLICEKLFAEEAGMFTTEPVTSISYFRPGSLQPLYMFELFGLLVALAIYNGITIPVSFPLALYAQLLHPSEGLDECHESFTLKDLKDGWPNLARSLQAVQDGQVPDTEWVLPMEANGLHFGIGKKAFIRLMREAKGYEQGNLDRITLPFSDLAVAGAGRRAAFAAQKALPRKHWPGWTLTADPTGTIHPTVPPATARQFVNPYIAWLTTYSVFPQLLAFKRGFRALFPNSALPLFTSRTFKTTIEGTTTLDLAALRRNTQYESFFPTDPYIQLFWKIVESWTPSEQKSLLKFVTAAERIPVTGAGALTFRISRAEGVGNEQLPTSSTCFGTLYLPRYEGEGVLEKRLKTAVEFGGSGFGQG